MESVPPYEGARSGFESWVLRQPQSSMAKAIMWVQLNWSEQATYNRQMLGSIPDARTKNILKEEDGMKPDIAKESQARRKERV